jgi:hypothetical protein
MTETAIQAVAMVVTVFLGMRVLYGSWPWEGDKTWYASRRLLMDKESIALSPDQIAHAAASAASAASLTKHQLESAKSSSETDSERVDAVIKDLLSDVGSDAKNPETSSEPSIAVVKELPTNADLPAEKNAA